ncbi:MAG: PKD domain-containing protein, partial [Candidatus Pacebacteria bacterium]|nr:PKD domain-containing protein [Candidatus Paceibacterota bacterium]
TGLCNSGTANTPYLNGAYWIWTCTGSNGGSTSSCFAIKGVDPVNGQCGSSNGGTFSSVPTTGLCNSGTATSVYGTGPWTWTCVGSNGGSTSSCFASKTIDLINGQCGSSNGGTFTTAPTTGLCNSGTASVVSGSGPWTWTCVGSNGGTTASCSTSIINSNPEITIVSTREVNENQTILLRASATDRDGDNLTYSWNCSGGTLSSSSIAMPYYTAPSLNNVNRTHSCTLTVNDGKGGYDSDSVSILIRTYTTSTNNIPQVTVSENREVKSGQSITIAGNVATDSDGDSLTYSWTCTGGVLTNKTLLNPTFTAPNDSSNANSYNCTLTVNDGKGGLASDSLSIVVRPNITSKNSAPVVAVANNREINPGQTLRLFALAYDPDGDPLTYKWTCSGGSLSDDANYITNFTPYSGSSSTYYSCKVVVSDGKLSTSGTVNITVRNINNDQPIGTPVVEAGNNKELNQGQTIIFNATASDPNGESLTYNWSCTQGMLSSNNILNPSYTAQYSSGYSTCTLTARNARGASASDSFSVRIRETNYYYQY